MDNKTTEWRLTKDASNYFSLSKDVLLESPQGKGRGFVEVRRPVACLEEPDQQFGVCVLGRFVTLRDTPQETNEQSRKDLENLFDCINHVVGVWLKSLD